MSSVGLNLGMETFGESMESYGDGYMVMMMNPRNAEERWKLVPGEATGSAVATCARPLTVERRMARARVPRREAHHGS
jgi:hypothetical protein